jgi:hypothetical protein
MLSSFEETSPDIHYLNVYGITLDFTSVITALDSRTRYTWNKGSDHNKVALHAGDKAHVFFLPPVSINDRGFHGFCGQELTRKV